MTTSASALAKAIQQRDTLKKAQYFIYAIIGSAYAVLAFYTLLKTIEKITRYADATPFGTIVLTAMLGASLTLMQLILAYGFFYYKKLLLHILTLHLAFIAMSALVLLPLLGATHYVVPTLIGSIYFAVPLIWCYSTKHILSKGIRTTTIVSAYFILISFVFTVQLILIVS